MGSEEQVFSAIDVERPSAARIYDYYLGGAHNFAVDRQVAEQMLTLFPQTAQVAQANRAFLRRAVEYMVDAGIRQFLDIGSGIPTVGTSTRSRSGLRSSRGWCSWTSTRWR